MRQLLNPFFTERIYFFLPPKPILFRGRFYIFRRAGTFVLNLIFRFAKLFIYFSKTNNSKKRKRGIVQDFELDLWQLDLIPIKVVLRILFLFCNCSTIDSTIRSFCGMEEPAGGHQAGKIPTQQCFGLRVKNSALNNIEVFLARKPQQWQDSDLSAGGCMQVLECSYYQLCSRTPQLLGGSNTTRSGGTPS